MAAGTGGTVAAVDTTGEYIFQVDSTTARAAGATTIRVVSDKANTTDLLVLVTGLHDSGAEDYLAPGEEGIYRFEQMGIREVFVKSASGTCKIRWGVRARTGSTG